MGVVAPSKNVPPSVGVTHGDLKRFYTLSVLRHHKLVYFLFNYERDMKTEIIFSNISS